MSHPEKNMHLWVTVLKEQATDFLGTKGLGWGEVRHPGMLYWISWGRGKCILNMHNACAQISTRFLLNPIRAADPEVTADCINFRYLCLLSFYLGVTMLVSDSPQSPSSFLGCCHWDAVGWEARQPSLRIIWRRRERTSLRLQDCLGRLHLLSFTGGSDLHPSLMTLPALASFLLIIFFFPHRHFL